MSTRLGDSEKLVKRLTALEPLGWRVENTQEGWKAFDRRGNMHVIHKTYSDRRSLTNLMSQLEGQGGLVADEAEMKRERLKARRSKLSNDRDAADRKALQIAGQQRELLVRAAGPYMAEIEEPDLEWMTSEHPAPWMRWMYITPKIAAYILEHHNADNREPAENTYDRYKLIVLSGQWHLTHQGLAFDTRGMLQDGQHRMWGILKAGDSDPDLKVPFAVFVGMPVENFKAIDEGRIRTAAQMLKKHGVAGGTHMVTLIRTVSAYDSPNPRQFNRQHKITNYEAFDAIARDPDGFAESMKLGGRGYKRTRITPGIMAAAHYLVARQNGRDNPYVTAFFEGIVTQRKFNTNLILPDDDPRSVLLRRFANNKPRNPVDGIVWILTAWNNLVRGHHPNYMRVNEDTPVPEILKCLPGQGQVPRALHGEIE